MGEFDLDIRHSYRVLFLDLLLFVYLLFPGVLETDLGKGVEEEVFKSTLLGSLEGD